MDKKEIKKVVSDTQKELEQKKREAQIAEIKKIVTKTLEKIDKLQKNKIDLEKQIKILKMDIDDLKDGKLDKIVERQEVDKEAKKTSVVIIKEKVIEREVEPPYRRPYWYKPYEFYWNYGPRDIVYDNNVVYGTNMTGQQTFSSGAESININCSCAKDGVTGTYDINGQIKHIR